MTGKLATPRLVAKGLALWLASLGLACGCTDATHTVGTLDVSAPITAGRAGVSGAASSGVGAAAGSAGISAGGTGAPIGGGGGMQIFDLDAALSEPVPGCTESAPARVKRLDLYLVVGTDITNSVSGGWTKITQGVGRYVRNQASAGIGLGVGFYGVTPPMRDGCDPTTYATAAVSAGMDPLPANAEAVQDAFSNVTPPMIDVLAPLGAALDGSLRYARSRAEFFVDQAQAVVFFSDGISDLVCMSTPQEMALVAEDAAAHGVPTFVVELATAPDFIAMIPVLNLAVVELGPVAFAGGTNGARSLDLLTASASDVERLLLEIQSEAQPCDYALPDGTAWGEAQLAISTSAGPRPLTPLAGEAECGPSGGVFLDDSSGTAWARACPASCAAIRTLDSTPVWLSGCTVSAQSPAPP